jgi:hypothetical protein
MPLLDRLEALVRHVGGQVRTDRDETPREVHDAVVAGLGQLRAELRTTARASSRST